MLKSNQYLPLTALPSSLLLISLHDFAGRSGMEPRETGIKKITFKADNTGKVNKSNENL